MPDSRDEWRSTSDRFRITPSELLAILAFWAVLAAVTAAARLLDPRIPLRPEISSALIALSFIEYAIWAALTIPIIWLASRLSGGGDDAQHRAARVALLLALGIVVAIGVDMVLASFRLHLLPPPTGRRVPSRLGNIVRFEFLPGLMVYFAIVGAGLARNYFLRYQARLTETQRLEAERAHLEARLAEAQLAVLRTQLNPHFLFNTLNAVSSLVERDPRGVRRMIARLGDLLRYTLEHSSEQEITLERELEVLRRYLDIMEVRFQGRLSVAIDVADDARSALVPNLILQPLVENALKHGVSAIDAPGRIEVRARRAGSDLVLTVRDNGPGPGPREGAVAGNGETSSMVGDGVGLRNTIARLEQLYGTRQRFALRAANGGDRGTVAEIHLPYHTVAATD